MAATANSIITPQTPFSATAIATTAEVGFNSPTNVVELIAPATNVNGARISKLYAIPRAATAAVVNCQIYKKVGTTYTLIDSAVTTNVTPSANVANPKTDFGLSDSNPMELLAGEGLAVAIGTTIGNGVVFRCEGGLY